MARYPNAEHGETLSARHPLHGGHPPISDRGSMGHHGMHAARRMSYTEQIHAVPQLVYLVRRLTEQAFSTWGLPGEDRDLGEMVATELFTNSTRETPGAFVEVSMTLEPEKSSVLFKQWDPSIRLPILKDPDILAERGRGLWIVRDICCGNANWFLDRSGRGGKIVWARQPVHMPGTQRRTGHASSTIPSPKPLPPAEFFAMPEPRRP